MFSMALLGDGVWTIVIAVGLLGGGILLLLLLVVLISLLILDVL